MENKVTVENEEDFEFILASTYIEDAIEGRHMQFTHTKQGLKIYQLYKMPIFRYLLFTLLVVDVLLALVETPCKSGWEMPYWATLCIEFICLMYFMGRIFHEMLVTNNFKVFWKDTKHVTNAIIIFITLVDICVYVTMKESGSPKCIRISRPLRAFLLVNFPEARQIRRAFRTVRRTLPELINVLILFMATLTLFTLMAVKLFERLRLENGTYFTDFFDSFWELYVLVTTANSPDIMMPAYDNNRAYVLFFVAFLLVNLYLFMRVFLAVIYNSYKENLKTEVQDAVGLRRDLLHKAFTLVCTTDGQMSKDNFKKVMKITVKDRDDEFWEVAWLVLNPKNETSLPLEEFYHINDLLHLRFTNINYQRKVWFPKIYSSPASKFLIKCVRHMSFRYFFDTIIIANAIFIAFNLDGGEPFFLALFTLEITLKLYAFGLKAFVRKLWNLFDTIVVASALIVTIIELTKLRRP